MKKHNYVIVDTETTKAGTVADFGAVVVTRQGEIVEQFGAMVLKHFGTIELFSNPSAPDNSLWSAQSARRREKDYYAMLDSGARSVVSVAGINQWLASVNARYNPVLTAYNISFDLAKCRNTRINLGIFGNRFCLMKAAKAIIGARADYQEFCYEQGLLTAKLQRPQMTADAMAKFILGDSLEDEPHTALEDARDYEAAILHYLLQRLTRAQLLEVGR